MKPWNTMENEYDNISVDDIVMDEQLIIRFYNF